MDIKVEAEKKNTNSKFLEQIEKIELKMYLLYNIIIEVGHIYLQCLTFIFPHEILKLSIIT